MKGVTVAVAGGFDPYHKGHRSHLFEAKLLGDYLIVIVATDEQLVMKKGWRLLPLEDRIAQVQDLWFVDEVVVNIDKENMCADTLALVKPNIFAKGGDRVPGNMPQKEIDVCNKLDIKIVYGVGDLLGSSTNYVMDVVNKLRGEQNASVYGLRGKIS